MNKEEFGLLEKNTNNLLRLTLVVEDMQKTMHVMADTNFMIIEIIHNLLVRIEKLERNK